MRFVYNPFTNKLDPTESGGGGGGGVTTINTISPDGGGNFSLVAGSGITLTGGTNDITIEASGSGGTYYSINPYIVGPDVNSQYTTIQAAITQAIADGVSSSNPKNIYIKGKSSAYAENLTAADGIRLIGLSVGASSSTNDFPNCSVIWNGTLTWASGNITIQNIRCAYSGVGTSITVPANGGIKAMNCQIQNSGGTVFGTSGDNPVFEFDTCWINAGVLFNSSAANIDFRAQKSYVVGTMTFSSGGQILADYCTFGSQINNGTGFVSLSVVMNFCLVTSGILINSVSSTSPGNSLRFNNCYLQNSSQLIRLNKGQAILQGCSGQCNSLFDDSYGSGGNSISIFSCNIIEGTIDVLGAGSQMYLYGCVGINAPSLGAGATVSYYDSLASSSTGNNSNTIINSDDVSTGASDGFLYLPACNGTPSGTPTTYGSSTPLVYDYAAKIGYVYADGAWNAMGGGGGGGIVTINGDSGSVTGSAISLLGEPGTGLYSGATVKFAATSATEMNLELSNDRSNMFLGGDTGNTSVTGINNTGIGTSNLRSLTTGNYNTSCGSVSFLSLFDGSFNVGLGSTAVSLTGGSYNIFIGDSSGSSYDGSESSNIIIGALTSGVNAENNTLRIGNATGTGNGQLNAAFIQGISGSTVTGAAVLCATDGQLGTISSSRKYKENISDFDNSSILNLRPVKFNYISDESKAPVYGLIAEEVEEKFPDLVLYRDGQPDSIKYHEMPALLLAEIQRLNKRIEALEAK